MTAPTAPGADKRVSDEQVERDVQHTKHFRLTVMDTVLLVAGYPADLRDARQALAAERARADKAERERERLREQWPEWATRCLALIRDCTGNTDDECDLPEELADLLSDWDRQHEALSAANARIRELEARRGGQVSEQDLALAKIAIRGTDNYTVKDIAGRNFYRLSAGLLPRFVAALAADPAPARAKQDGEGRS